MLADSWTAIISTVATFPEHYFLENLVVRRDGSILVTALNQAELWYIPPPSGRGVVSPVLIDTLDRLPMSIVETEPDVFYVCTLDEATLNRIDMRNWTPGTPLDRQRVLTFDQPDAGLNGSCLLAPDVILIADCVLGQIWRVDVTDDGRAASASVWLKDETMAASYTDPFAPIHITPTVEIPMPGVNGVRYASASNMLYYTNTAAETFLRIAVDPVTLGPLGQPEIVATGLRSADDFCLDDAANVAYVTTHIDNSIKRVPLQPTSSTTPQIVAGDPFNDELVGPSSIAWARGGADLGHLAYITTDGGHTGPPPDGIIRAARVLRLELVRV